MKTKISKIKSVVDEIDKLVKKYEKNGGGIKSLDAESVVYDLDIGGHKVGIMYVPSQHLLVGGLKYGVARFTRKAEHYYKKVLNDLEQDILSWRKEHNFCEKGLTNG